MFFYIRGVYEYVALRSPQAKPLTFRTSDLSRSIVENLLWILTPRCQMLFVQDLLHRKDPTQETFPITDRAYCFEAHIRQYDELDDTIQIIRMNTSVLKDLQ